MSEPGTVETVSSSTETDHYVESAEMYDILSEGHWQARRDSVTGVLRRARLGPDDWIVDVGSGTGPSVAVIAEALPSNPILAIEPSASMRVGLMTRLLSTPGLRQRVSIRAATYGDALLPDTVGIFTVCGCIGYFDADERAFLWKDIARRLAPSGMALVDVMPLSAPIEVEEYKIASASVGSNRYDIFLRGRPVDHEVIHWSMRFEEFDGSRLLRRFAIERDWRAFGLDLLLKEAAREGLSAKILDDSPVPTAIFTKSSA